jgi:hypothetical protein
MTRAPATCASSRGVRTSLPPRRMMNLLMAWPLPRGISKVEGAKGALEQTKACLPKAWALFLVTL